MNDTKDKDAQRRQLLKWFSASPLLSAAPVGEVWAQDKGRRPDPMLWTSNTNVDDLIKNQSEAVNVFDFEPVAFKKVPPAHFGYMASGVDVSKQIVRRMEKAGVPVLEITVDRSGGRNQETLFKLRKQDPRACVSCHVHGFGTAQARPNYAGIDMSNVKSMQSSNMTWDFIKHMRDASKMKIVLKGILTQEDAELCLKYGVDGIHVSNHGGAQRGRGQRGHRVFARNCKSGERSRANCV